MVESKELACACARAASDQKAENVRVMDLRGISSLTNFMVVCSGNSMPHLRSILREVEGDVIKWFDVKSTYAEGKAETQWMVLDFIDVMVHVMDEDIREHYGLEDLWKDAAEIDWESWEVPA